MGMYAHVAGWLEWLPQSAGGGYSRHLFFGSTVRESAVNELRAQVSRIASEASSRDGETADYPAGIFRAVCESEGMPTELWHISAGALRIEKSA